jgi:hypothetical protein
MKLKLNVMSVKIRVKDNNFVEFIETCLKFMGSGEYGYADYVFTLKVCPTHVWLPKYFISDVLEKEGYDPSQIFEYEIA